MVEQIIYACRLYKTALELIEDRPDITYQLLISATETMAGVAVPADYKPGEAEILQTQRAATVFRGAQAYELDEAKAKALALLASQDNPWAKRKFKKFITDNVSAEEVETMAYRLVRLALNDSNPETKHIQLVTAIEVVLKHQDRPKNILAALDKLLAEVDTWSDPAVKKRMKEILRENKKEESITRAGSEQVTAMLDDTYNEKPTGKFFKDVYNMRSGLVHREKPGRPRPTIDEVRKIAAELQRFVLDLLDAYEAA